MLKKIIKGIGSVATGIGVTGGTNGFINVIKSMTGIKVNGNLQKGISLAVGVAAGAAVACGGCEKAAKKEANDGFEEVTE